MKNIFKNIVMLLIVGLVGLASVEAQNLAGVTFSTSVGVADGTLGCDKAIGSNNGFGYWRAFPAGSCGSNTACNNRNDACRAAGWCMYDSYGFKNIINIPVCITVNTVTGSCGFNIHGTAYSSPYNAPTTGFCDQNPDFITNQGGSGTASWGFENEGCSPFYITYSSVYNTATCTYSFNISPDPLLDLRCSTDPAVCIEKVKIGGTPVPTMTQWGLFLFGLIILTLGVVTIYNMSTSSSQEQA